MSDEVPAPEGATSTAILYEASGATTVHIEARVGPSGVTVAGHDLGQAPSEFFGESDYEYECTVVPADRDALLLALLRDRFQGRPDAYSAFKTFCATHGIEAKTWSF